MALKKASELLDYIIDFCEYGFSIGGSTPVKNVLGVIDTYLQFHKERGFLPTDIAMKYERFKNYTPVTNELYGINIIRNEELQKKIHGEFLESL